MNMSEKANKLMEEFVIWSANMRELPTVDEIEEILNIMSETISLYREDLGLVKTAAPIALKQQHYHIVLGNSPQELEANVSDLIKLQGFEAHGAPSMSQCRLNPDDYCWYQAVVK